MDHRNPHHGRGDPSMTDNPQDPLVPPLDPEPVARALRATLPAEEAEGLVQPLADGIGWFPLSPGLHPVNLAIAVTSAAFAEWLKSTLGTADEVRVVDRILTLPEDRALKEIREGKWDPPYSDPG